MSLLGWRARARDAWAAREGFSTEVIVALPNIAICTFYGHNEAEARTKAARYRNSNGWWTP